MNSDSISQEAINAWRDYVLKQIVENLEANKDKIMDQFEHENNYHGRVVHHYRHTYYSWL